jgi:SPP1 gp7 family putative phage head morphogenesis protein
MTTAKPLALLAEQPIEAIRLARAQKVVLPQVFYGEMTARARQMAFSVAGLGQISQLAAVKRSLDQALADGESFAKWKARVRAGEIPLALPASRLEVIFRTNIQSAYNRGRWQRLQQRTRTHPYWMYDAVNDSRTRPAHAAMDNTVLRHDHPWWSTHYPPNGYQCRCRVVGLTTADAERRGLTTIPTAAAPDAGWAFSPGEAPKLGLQQAVAAAKVTPTGSLFRERLAEIDAELAKPTTLLSELKRTLGDRVYGEVWSAVRETAAAMGVSLEAAIAMRAYTRSEFYREANEVMRYMGSSVGATVAGIADPDRFLPLISGIFKFIEETKPYLVKVTRVVNSARLPSEFLQAHRRGVVVQYEAVSSTSAPGGATMAGDVVLHIDQRSGRSVRDFSAFASEREVILPSGSLFEVTGRRTIGGRLNIYLREIDAADVKGRKVYHFSHG